MSKLSFWEIGISSESYGKWQERNGQEQLGDRPENERDSGHAPNQHESNSRGHEKELGDIEFLDFELDL